MIALLETDPACRKNTWMSRIAFKLKRLGMRVFTNSKMR